jgi:hypothetical protein
VERKKKITSTAHFFSRIFRMRIAGLLPAKNAELPFYNNRLSVTDLVFRRSVTALPALNGSSPDPGTQVTRRHRIVSTGKGASVILRPGGGARHGGVQRVL